MKPILPLFVFFAASALTVCAQEAKSGPVLVEPKTAQKEPAQKHVDLTPLKPANELWGKSVFYRGYLMDLLRSDQKRELFDLRAPVDPSKDLENLIFYPGTETVRAVVLFRIKF